MMDPHSLYEYSMSLQDSSEGQELRRRLELFQAFTKLYERHRDLLNEILALDSGQANLSYKASLFSYIQGVISGAQVGLATNLLEGRSQLLVQPQNTWLIGRDYNQVSLPIRDMRLSRRHAAIQYLPQTGFFLIDLGSTNGTYVNGERIRKQILLQDGDRIRLGSMTFSFFICRDFRTLPELPNQVIEEINELQMPITNPDELSSGEISTLSGPEETNNGTDGIPPHLLDETMYFIKQRYCN